MCHQHGYIVRQLGLGVNFGVVRDVFIDTKEKFLISYYTKVTTLLEVVPLPPLTFAITNQKLLLNLPLNKGKQKDPQHI